MQVVAINEYEYLQEHLEHPLNKCSIVLPLETKNEFDTQQDTDSTRLRKYKRSMKKIRSVEKNFKVRYLEN